MSDDEPRRSPSTELVALGLSAELLTEMQRFCGPVLERVLLDKAAKGYLHDEVPVLTATAREQVRALRPALSNVLIAVYEHGRRAGYAQGDGDGYARCFQNTADLHKEAP